MHNVLSDISSEVQLSSFRGTIWKSSSSSLSSEYSGVFAGVVLRFGEVTSGVASSSDGINNSPLCTGLGGACNVFHGVSGSGSNEVCSMLETWWILGVFLSRVDKSIVSKWLS